MEENASASVPNQDFQPDNVQKLFPIDSNIVDFQNVGNNNTAHKCSVHNVTEHSFRILISKQESEKYVTENIKEEGQNQNSGVHTHLQQPTGRCSDLASQCKWRSSSRREEHHTCTSSMLEHTLTESLCSCINEHMEEILYDHRSLQSNEQLTQSTPTGKGAGRECGLTQDECNGSEPISKGLLMSGAEKVAKPCNHNAQTQPSSKMERPIRRRWALVSPSGCRKSKTKKKLSACEYFEVARIDKDSCIDGEYLWEDMVFRPDSGSDNCFIVEDAAELIGWDSCVHKSRCSCVHKVPFGGSGRCIGCFSTMVKFDKKSMCRIKFHVLAKGSLPGNMKILIGRRVGDREGIM